MNLTKQESTTVRVFLIGDGVQCALRGQETHQGYYNIERMMSSVARRGEVSTRGTCAKASAVEPETIIDEVINGNMQLLTDWNLEADHSLVF